MRWVTLSVGDEINAFLQRVLQFMCDRNKNGDEGVSHKIS